MAHRVDRRDATDRRIARWVVVLVGCVYALTTGGHLYSIDESTTLETTRALVHGERALERAPDLEGALVAMEWRRGEYIGVYGIGNAISAVPAYGAAQILGVTLPAGERELLTRLFVVWVNSVIGAFTAALLYLLSRLLGATRRWALLITVAGAFGTMIGPQAGTFWTETGTAALVLWAIYLALRSSVERRPRLVIGVGATLGVALLFRLTPALFMPLIGAYAVLLSGGGRGERWRRFRCLVAGAVPLIAALGAVNWWRYGSPFHTGYDTVHYDTALFRGLHGLVASPGRSVLLYAPPLVASMIALTVAGRRHWREVLLLAGPMVISVVYFARFRDWEGGLSWGPRYLVPAILPLVAAAALVARPPRWLWRTMLITTVLGALGPALLGAAVYFNAVYGATFAEVAAAGGRDATNPEDTNGVIERYSFVLRSSPLILHAQHVPEALRMTARRIDGHDSSITGPAPTDRRELLHYNERPIQLDMWWAWWLAAGGPAAVLLMAPILVVGAGFAGWRIGRAVRGPPTQPARSRTSPFTGRPVEFAGAAEPGLTAPSDSARRRTGDRAG